MDGRCVYNWRKDGDTVGHLKAIGVVLELRSLSANSLMKAASLIGKCGWSVSRADRLLLDRNKARVIFSELSCRLLLFK